MVREAMFREGGRAVPGAAVIPRAHTASFCQSWVVGSWLEAGNMGIPEELGQMERGRPSRHRQTPAPGEPHGTLPHTSEQTPGVATRAERERDEACGWNLVLARWAGVRQGLAQLC